MTDTTIAFVNFAKKNEGTAIAARLYYEAAAQLGLSVKWYQLADSVEINDYMAYPTVITGARLPFKCLRMGYDRLIHMPRVASSIISEDHVFISDPTAIGVGLRKGHFMLKVHDFIRLTEYSPGFTSWAMFNYVMKRAKHADTIIVTTMHMKRQLEKHLESVDKTFVVPEPVNDSFDSFDSSYRHGESDRRKINVLYVSADRPYKNIKMFLDIARLFQERRLMEYRFTLVSKLKEDTLSYATGLSLKNLEIQEGVKSLVNIYKDADILLYPSLVEGFGRPIVEAMAAGIPTIARDVDPFREIIGDSGILLKSDNVEDWAEAIESLWARDRYIGLSRKCRARFEKTYSGEVFRTDLLKAFSAFLDNTVE